MKRLADTSDFHGYQSKLDDLQFFPVPTLAELMKERNSQCPDACIKDSGPF